MCTISLGEGLHHRSGKVYTTQTACETSKSLAARQKLSPPCLAAIFDSRLPSPELSLKSASQIASPSQERALFLFQTCPRREGNCATIERLILSRGNFCLSACRCLSRPSGHRGLRPRTKKQRRVSTTVVHAFLFPGLFIDLLMGLLEGPFSPMAGGARKQPIKQLTEMPTSTTALMGRFPF